MTASTTNPYKRFKEIMGESRRSVVEVVGVYADGTSLVSARTGDVFRVNGNKHAVGVKVWIEGDAIVGDAPRLPAITITI